MGQGRCEVFTTADTEIMDPGLPKVPVVGQDLALHAASAAWFLTSQLFMLCGIVPVLLTFCVENSMLGCVALSMCC